MSDSVGPPMTDPKPYTPEELDRLESLGPLDRPYGQRLKATVRAAWAERDEAQGHSRDHHLEVCETCAVNESERVKIHERAMTAERDLASLYWREHGRPGSEGRPCRQGGDMTIAAKDAEIARLRSAGQRLYDYAVALDRATAGYFLSRSFAVRPEGGREAGNAWRAVVPQPRAKDADLSDALAAYALSAPGDTDQENRA